MDHPGGERRRDGDEETLEYGRPEIGFAGVVTVLALGRQTVEAQGFPAWLALYGDEQIGWLENENRLAQACRDAETADRCRDEQLRPKVWVAPLRATADSMAPTVGELIVTAVPGRGLAAAYLPQGASILMYFTPDLYLQEWGYAPLFHQTISNRRGDWFELPAGPWPRSVWILDTRADERDRIRSVQQGDILVWEGAGWTVTGAELDALALRPEQPADMWCQEGEAPPVSAAQPLRVTRSDLQDQRGHLVIGIRYPKGC